MNKDNQIPTLKEAERILNDAAFDKKYLTVQDCKDRHQRAPDSLWFYLAQGNISMLYGPPDEAKSFLALGLAIAIAEGQTSYLDWEIKARYNTAIYVSYEDAASDLGWRFNKMGTGNLQTLYILTIDVVKPQDVLNEIDQIFRKEGRIDLIVLDPLRSLLKKKSTIDDSDMSHFMEDVQYRNSEWNSTILGIGHSTKGSRNSWDVESLKGVQEQAAALRLVYKLTDKFIGIVKGNHVPRNEKEIAYELEWLGEVCQWRRTGASEYQSILEQSENDVQRKVDVLWNDVFGENKEMRTGELVPILIASYHVSERSAKTYIKEDLDVVRHGVYRIPG